MGERRQCSIRQDGIVNGGQGQEEEEEGRGGEGEEGQKCTAKRTDRKHRAISTSCHRTVTDNICHEKTRWEGIWGRGKDEGIERRG